MFPQVRRQPLFVSYHGYPNMWHARVLLSEIKDLEWITITPDGDMYPESLGLDSTEIRAVMDRGAPGVVPYALTVGGSQVYDFDTELSDAQLDLLVRVADALAHAERARRGLPDPPSREVHHRVTGKQPRASLVGGTDDGAALVVADDAAVRGGRPDDAGLCAYPPPLG